MTPQLARNLDTPARKRSVSDPLVPLGRTWALHTEVQQVFDAVVVVAAMLIAYEIRAVIGVTSTRLNPVLPLESYLWVFAVLLPVGLIHSRGRFAYAAMSLDSVA